MFAAETVVIMKNLTRPTSCAIVPLLMVLLLHTLQAQAQGPCTDVSPPGRYTCEQQKSYGKCDEDWMVRGQFCAKTCTLVVPTPSHTQYCTIAVLIKRIARI